MKYIYVLDENGKPLMPTKRLGMVRRWLKSGEAHWYKNRRDTIQFNRKTTDYTQETVLGCDLGNHLGISVIANNQEVYSGESYCNGNETHQKMQKRKMYRKTKRNRLRHRQARFNNRKKSGYAPSINRKLQFQIKEIQRLIEFLPISKMIFEGSVFDINKLTHHTQLQKGYKTTFDFLYARDNGCDALDTTLLFETVDPVNDQHVVKYEKLHTYPIAIVANNREGQWLSSKPDKKHIKNKTFQNWSMFEIDSQSWINTINIFGDTPEAKRQALDTLKSLIRQDQLEYPHKEGLVLYGRNMMLKVKTSYYHKAFELATQLDRYEAGHDIKNVWQFGAKNWARFCLDMQDTHFTPDLALKLEKFDKQYNIHNLLKQIHLDRDTINHDKLEEVKKLWKNFE